MKTKYKELVFDPKNPYSNFNSSIELQKKVNMLFFNQVRKLIVGNGADDLKDQYRKLICLKYISKEEFDILLCNGRRFFNFIDNSTALMKCHSDEVIVFFVDKNVQP